MGTDGGGPGVSGSASTMAVAAPLMVKLGLGRGCWVTTGPSWKVCAASAKKAQRSLSIRECFWPRPICRVR